MALMVFMNELITSLEKGEIVVGVFLDFSKAFDTIDHHLYLVCNYCTPILFADDTNLFISGFDIDHMHDMLDDELHHLSHIYLIANKLSWHVKKTYYMVITKKGSHKMLRWYKNNGQVIWSKQNEFFCVIIDDKIYLRGHISYIAGKKVTRGIGMMIKARKYLQKEAKLTPYYTFIYPYYTNCDHTWGATYISNLRKLIKLQNAVLQIMCNVERWVSVTSLYG